MGAMILPSRFAQQPQQPAPVDRSSPLSAGLAGSWVPQNATARAINGATSVVTSSGLAFATTTSAYWQASPTAVISQSATWTILAIVSGAQVGTGNGFPLYCERPNDTQLIKLQIGLSGASTANLIVRDANSVGLVNVSGTTDVRTATGSRIIVGTRRGIADHRLFVNGRQEGSSAINAGATFADTSATLGYDIRDPGAALTTAALPLVLVWNRSLTDAEIAEVSRNPWQIFKAPPRRLWYAAPGAVDTTLAGAATSQASAAGALSTSIRLTAGAAAVASATGAMSTAVRMIGSASATASGAGALSTAIALTGNAAAQAIATGPLSTAIQLSGAATASASASGTLAGGAATLVGAAVANATASGALTTVARMAGAAAAQAGASGSLSTQIKLTGAASAGASASGALSTGIAMSGTAQATASASGTLAGGAAQLSGAAAASVSAVGALATGIRLSGAVTAQASASGALAGTGAVLSGAAVASASASGALLTTIRMTGLAAASASASGALGTAGVQLSGSAVTRASASGALWTSIRLAGAALAQASAAGDLTAPGRDNFARAPDGPGYSPQRIESQARSGSTSTARPANTQRNYR